MFTVIDGRTYYTKFATKLAERRSILRSKKLSASTKRSKSWQEILYRSRHGRLFLAGKGGRLTSWAVTADDGTLVGGRGIIPLTRAQAMQWCATHDKQNALLDILLHKDDPLADYAAKQAVGR